jgi:hypothetical protein
VAKSKTIVRDFGYRRFMQLADDVSKGVVTVGVHGGDYTDPNGGGTTSLAMVASVNEFGSKDGRVPERSFLRSTTDEQLPALRALRDQVVGKIVLGQMTPRKGLGIMGAYLAAKVQAKIASGIPPPNAPSTIAAKGSSRTLINKGQLRQSITYEVHPNGFAANAEVEE